LSWWIEGMFLTLNLNSTHYLTFSALLLPLIATPILTIISPLPFKSRKLPFFCRGGWLSTLSQPNPYSWSATGSIIIYCLSWLNLFEVDDTSSFGEGGRGIRRGPKYQKFY